MLNHGFVNCRMGNSGGCITDGFVVTSGKKKSAEKNNLQEQCFKLAFNSPFLSPKILENAPFLQLKSPLKHCHPNEYSFKKNLARLRHVNSELCQCGTC